MLHAEIEPLATAARVVPGASVATGGDAAEAAAAAALPPMENGWHHGHDGHRDLLEHQRGDQLNDQHGGVGSDGVGSDDGVDDDGDGVCGGGGGGGRGSEPTGRQMRGLLATIERGSGYEVALDALPLLFTSRVGLAEQVGDRVIEPV